MKTAVPASPVDAELDAIVALSEARLLLHVRKLARSRCACCGFACDPRNTLVVNRAACIVYHPSCAP